MQVRYIEIKTSPEGQTIKAYTPAQYKKEMTRRKNAAARARKLTRLQERVGAVLAMLGFLMLLGAGGMCEIGQIIGYGLAGLFLFVFGVWLAHGFYGQADNCLLYTSCGSVSSANAAPGSMEQSITAAAISTVTRCRNL